MRTKTLKSLQSYILSTTTETRGYRDFAACCIASIVHPFNNNWNELLSRKHCAGLASIVHPFNNNWNWILCVDLWSIRLGFNRTSFQQQLKLAVFVKVCQVAVLQSYILSTTTETFNQWRCRFQRRFNRTSFQQQLKRCFSCWIKAADGDASIVHPFNNNWNRSIRTGAPLRKASIVHPFNNNWNIRSGVSAVKTASFNRTSFQQQLKHGATLVTLPSLSASIVHPFNNNWNGLATSNFSRAWVSFNRTSFQQQLKLIPKKGKIPPLTKLSLIFNR